MKRAWQFVSLGVLLPLLLLLALLLASGGAAIQTPIGTAYLLSSISKLMPQLTVVQPKGALLGTFQARRIEWHGAGQRHVVLIQPSWSGLSLHRASHTRWKLAVRLATWHADSLTVDWPSAPPSPTDKALPTLEMPLAVSVKAVSIGSIQSPQLGRDALKLLKGSLDLQSLQGLAGKVQHRITLSSMQWQVWRVSGDVTAVPGRNMVLDASLNATSPTGHADVQLHGPLQQLQAQGQVTINPAAGSSPSATEPLQVLKVRAVLMPLSAWPVASAQVNASQFDLKRLNNLWPASLLTGQISMLPAKLNQRGVPTSLDISAQISNEATGPWDAGKIPLSKIDGNVQLPVTGTQSADWMSMWRAGSVQATLRMPTQNRRAGTIEMTGRWNMDDRQYTAVKVRLENVDTKALHTQAPALRLNGPLSVQGTPDQAWRLSGELIGEDRGQGLLPQAVKAQWQARWQPDHWWLDSLKLQSAGAQADAKGQWQRQADGRWQAQGDINLKDLDPAVWMPWPRPSGDKVQATRLKGSMHWQAAGQGEHLPTLSELDGSTEGQLTDSRLLGVVTSGQWRATVKQKQIALQATLKASGNDADIQATLPLPRSAKGAGATAESSMSQLVGMQADVKIQATALAALQPWATPFAVTELGGQLMGQVQITLPSAGQWQTKGQVQSDKLTAHWQGQPVSLQGLRATWALASDKKSSAWPWQVNATAEQARWADWQMLQMQAELQGTAAQHTWRTSARVDLPARKLPSGRVYKESLRAQWVGEGHWRSLSAERSQWSANVTTLRLAPLTLDVIPTWLDAQAFDIQLDMNAHALQWQISPTRVSLLGLVFDIQQAKGQVGGQNHFDVQATMAPVRVAELLGRWQPRAGWGGDLALDGTLQVAQRQGQPWEINANVGRREGDLTLTETDIEGSSAQALGIKQIVLNLSAKNGVWTARETLEGVLLGKVEARQVVKPSNPLAWPAAADALQGDLTAAISDARALGAWAPAGWRLAGQIEAQAALSGTLGQPQYRGVVTGRQLGAQNALLGIDLSGGDLRMSLQGSQAQLEQLTLKGGGSQGGVLQVTGQASLSGQPQADLKIQAQRFSLLNRSDRQARLTGLAHVQLKGSDNVKVDGEMTFDKGYFDISREEAPTVGDDVNVINRADRPDRVQAAETAADSPGGAKRQWQVNMALNLGEQLLLKGRGIDTRLSGALKLTTLNGRSQLHGTVATVNGTYASYGQKLLIERGSLAFSGPLDNPRLDIKAMRAQSPSADSSDVKVGVLINGTALDPRVRLYSEPPMSETEKLSWLVLGRGPTGLGVADIGLLQTAASALWGGEGGSPSDSLIGAIGLDELSVRQTDGAVRDTIVTLGKQISRRWYLGYERSLNNTTGSWQAIYRAAQRFTLRFQTGDENAVDLIWLWRRGE